MSSYFIGKVAVEIPITLLMPAVFTLLIYFGIGLAITFKQVCLFYLILMLLQFCAASYAYFLGSIFERGESAVLIAPLFI